MAIPLTEAEAKKNGLKALTPDEVAQVNRSGGITFTGELYYLCYMGPCSGGRRTICYNNGAGCNACYTTSEGC